MISAPRKTFLITSWNIRDLGDNSKCTSARDALSVASPTVCCLQETKLACTSTAKARTFLPVPLADFATLDADGSRGGVLTAWDAQLLSLVSTSHNSYNLTTRLASTTSDIDFSVTNVYAPSDHNLTSAFATEMLSLAAAVTGPWLVIGDFNLICYPSDKNNSNFDRSLATAFNSLIRDSSWMKLPLRDRLYTWTNAREVSVLARFDRAFFNSDWDAAFPNSHLSSLPCPVSDHHPIMVSACTTIPNPSHFRFENSWLLDPLFLPSTYLAGTYGGLGEGRSSTLLPASRGSEPPRRFGKGSTAIPHTLITTAVLSLT
jgi:exonuclease III